MELPNNAATRLYNILTEAALKPGNKRTGDIWEELLRSPKGDRAELLRKLMALVHLYLQVRTKVELVPKHKKEHLLENFPNIEAVLYLNNMDASWETYRTKLTPVTLFAIKSCALELFELDQEPSISDDELARLQHEILDLITEITASSVDQRLKTFIVDHLSLVLKAISDYQISGFEGVQVAIERSFGSAVLRPEIREKIETTEEGRKFKDMLKNVALVLSIATQALGIGSKVYRAAPTIEKVLQGLPAPSLPQIPDDLKPVHPAIEMSPNNLV